ncbi:MAG TPA: ABC transporter substrate-binding protein [Casimicrobiaceae bacterium]|jgi:putative ABC transport system substrate-binding protein|nr:ABC transporter substrate-binding protein [Casimicrobiaceae bacterium]
MDRRTFLSGMAIGALATPAHAQAPASGRVARIGILSMRNPDVANPFTDALLEGLRERGYVPGSTLAIDYPDAKGREERLPELAAGLVRNRVDVILVIGPAPLEPARKATRTIPIVMVASSSDPVAEGIAQSLGRPGGNVTGLTYAEPDRFKKQLEVLKSVAVRTRRVAVLWDFDVEIYRRQWELPLAAAARVLDLEVLAPVRVREAGELPGAFAQMKQRGADATLVASGGLLLPARAQVANLALEHRLPAIAAFREFAHAGLLMSYGPDLPDINRRAGGFVDRILRGARAGDLPIELPIKFDLAINLATARALGLAVPPSVLVRANEIIS